MSKSSPLRWCERAATATLSSRHCCPAKPRLVYRDRKGRSRLNRQLLPGEVVLVYDLGNHFGKAAVAADVFLRDLPYLIGVIVGIPLVWLWQVFLNLADLCFDGLVYFD